MRTAGEREMFVVPPRDVQAVWVREPLRIAVGGTVQNK